MNKFFAGQKVRCIDDTNIDQGITYEPGDCPVIGVIYTVKWESGSDLRLEELNMSWLKKRFQPVDTINEPIVHDVFCPCGKKCSSDEKSCWWCGNPLSMVK